MCLPALTAVSASPLQSFTSALRLSPSSRLSLAILYIVICLPVSTFVSQLWTAAAASALQSFASQLWTSQTLVAECSDIEKHKLFGPTVVSFSVLL